MPRPLRVLVFDARTLKSLALNDRHGFPDELAAFRVAFQGRRFRLLLTDGILSQYIDESSRAPQFLPQPALNNLTRIGRAIYFDENRLNRASIELESIPREHRAFILDAIGAEADYFITDYSRWLNLSEQSETRYGLRIVTPARFVELEG